jgi:hypothetical protein
VQEDSLVISNVRHTARNAAPRADGTIFMMFDNDDFFASSSSPSPTVVPMVFGR